MHRLYSPHQINNLFARSALVIIALSALLSGCVSGNTPKPQPYLREQGDYFMQAGIKSYEQYNFALATEQFNQAKTYYSRFDDYLGTTHALLNLAQVNITIGKFDTANQNLIDSTRLIDRYGLKTQAEYRDLLLTNIYLNTGKLNEASRIFDNYQETLHSPSLDETLLSLLINRVRFAQLSNQDFSDWLDILIKQADKHVTVELSSRILRFSAASEYSGNNSGNGDLLFSNAIDNYRDQANPSGLMSTQLEWAQACTSQNDWPHATEHYEQALKLAITNKHLHNGIIALDGLRAIYKQTGDQDKLKQVDEWANELKTLTAESM